MVGPLVPGAPSSTPLRVAVPHHRVDHAAGMILDCRGQPNPVIVPGRIFALAVAFLLLATPAAAADKKPPYWASIASGQAMMRTGPARKYPGIWLYQRRDLPVRVVAVYETWRKIEDPDGQQGWMLVTMLSDKRSVVMKAGGAKAVRSTPDASGRVAYRAEPGVVGKIDQCKAGWCHIAIGKREGYVAVGDVWGVSEDEAVD